MADKKDNSATNATKKATTPKEDVDKDISTALEELSKVRDAKIFPMFFDRASISTETVDNIFDDLREKFTKDNDFKRLDVILESGGGDIDAAYNIALLLRRYAKEELNIIVPRWAKSAATIIACAGNKILMTPIAELGPVDPQITMVNPLENRLERFSPLDIGSTLQLIREEFEDGNEKLAQGLLQRLQFPLTLGGIKKSLEVGTHYIETLLSTRMLVGDGGKNRAREIAKNLVQKYPTHAFCIDIDEASDLGLKAELLPGEQIELIWRIRKLIHKKRKIEEIKKSDAIKKLLPHLPPEILKDLTSNMMEQGDPKSSNSSVAEDKEVRL